MRGQADDQAEAQLQLSEQKNKLGGRPLSALPVITVIFCTQLQFTIPKAFHSYSIYSNT